jgi:RimJ/RimL family protein N-acetyltransferase
MIELREAVTDEDLEAWRQVRIAILPNERTASVEEIRRTASPEQRLLLAELGGEVVGSGAANRSDLGGAALFPRVLPAFRRRGFGTTLLRALATRAESLGHAEAGSLVDDEGSLAFAERFGFRETGRQIEQVRAIAEREERPRAPDGVRLVSLVERPELRGRTYRELALQAFEDMPTPSPVSIGSEQWEREWITWPEGSFVALAGDEIVGCAGLIRDDDRPDRAENSLTAVRRDWRGRGLARALKERTIAWAAEQGLREIYTWTQTGNENMRAVNERLGYVTRNVAISVRGPLPLPA